MTQGDDPDPSTADQAPAAADDIPLVVFPNEDVDTPKQDHWCLPGLPQQSGNTGDSDVQDTEAGTDAATSQGQDAGMHYAEGAAAGMGAHGEASASLQYWSSRLLR